MIAADLLQAIINKATGLGLLRKPIATPDEDFPIVQYANNTLLIMEADACQLFFLKGILQSFSDSTGLKVNYHKSQMIPINVSTEKMQHFWLSDWQAPIHLPGPPHGYYKAKIPRPNPHHG